METETIERFLEFLPGGFTEITGGGTRNQLKLLPNSLEIMEGAICPFETRPQEEIPVQGLPQGWRVLNNIYTPHLNHRLVIPPTCWPKKELQELGGPLLWRSLEACSLAIAGDDFETSCFTHVGRAGGQNLQHHHWHAMQVLVRKPLGYRDFAEAMKPERIVFKNDSFTAFAGGVRAGECHIVPDHEMTFRESMNGLGYAIWNIVRLGNEKFSDPSFMVTIRFSDKGIFRYADYCPVLNFWGCPEYVISHLEGGPITLPHTHELTAQILRR